MLKRTLHLIRGSIFHSSSYYPSVLEIRIIFNIVIRYSYQYVEKSVQNGKLENLEDHRAGPAAGDVRPVGSTHISARAHRVPFSAEDDRILRGWLGPYEKAGGSISGNKIYQELEAKVYSA